MTPLSLSLPRKPFLRFKRLEGRPARSSPTMLIARPKTPGEQLAAGSTVISSGVFSRTFMVMTAASATVLHAHLSSPFSLKKS